MRRILLSVFLLQMVSFAYGEEFSDPSSGCAISMKISMNPVKPEDQSGSAVVEIKLAGKAGDPIAGKDLVMTATWGTFLCRLSQDTAAVDSGDPRSCFVTGQDGKALINLVNLPINSPVNVKAVCDCGDYVVSATGNLSIKQIRKRK